MAKEMALEATEKIKLISRGEPVLMMGRGGGKGGPDGGPDGGTDDGICHTSRAVANCMSAKQQSGGGQ